MYNYQEMFSLRGRCAVVTGGAGILGTTFCHALASHGANVVIADCDLGKADELCAQIGNGYSVNSRAIECDVADEKSVKALIDCVQKDFGSPQILVNNAATKSASLQNFFASIEDYSAETWREVMSVNLDGMFFVAREFGKAMQQNSTSGSIVQIASIYGVVADDDRIYDGSEYMGTSISNPPVYSTSKAGVIGLTRHLAAHWAPHNIRVNSISPGGVGSGQNNAFTDKYSARVPMKRMAASHEVAGAVVFLASDASSYMTGQNLIIDGGLSAW